jgi:hypothetical protein
VKSFFEWFAASGIAPSNPWLILGKGPSFSQRDSFDLKPYRLVSINHAVREQPVTVAHVIDADVIDACEDVIEKNAKVVVMPWIPHVKNGPGPLTLEETARNRPALGRLKEQGRLLWYNLGTGREVRDGSPVVPVKYFSGEAVLNLLATAGVRTIRSLGVDGGASYSPAFEDLKDKTLLANKWNTFDLQFAGMAATIVKTGVDYAPLTLSSPIRVYVAATEKEMLPAKVLEYSIRKRTPMTVDVLPLCRAGLEIPTPKVRQNLPRTTFSFQRFLIPALAGHRGRAIYLDADMLAFRNFMELWTRPFDGAEILSVGEPVDPSRRPQFSVMVLNCDLLKWDVRSIVDALDRGELTYETLMYDMSVASKIRADLEPEWNSLERYEEGKTAVLHYTDMPTQPWVFADHPLGHLWSRELLEAVDLGLISLDFLKDEAAKGHIRPSLVVQVQERVDEGLLLSNSVRDLDKAFSAPYRSLPRRRGFGVLRALVRSAYHKSPVPRWLAGVRRRLTQRQ